VGNDTGRRFGSASLRVSGICDGSEGVQWNAWVEWDEHEQLAFVGVNLEGKKYDGWPVGRLIERELRKAQLFEASGKVARPDRVQVVWYRDAWQAASRPAIVEKLIGGSPQLLHGLSPTCWATTLQEAGQFLGPQFYGRARQLLTVGGVQKRFDVSPHLQFRRGFWPRDAGSTRSWRAALVRIVDELQPLYDFVKSQSAM
jgi:hypothetical protein